MNASLNVKSQPDLANAAISTLGYTAYKQKEAYKEFSKTIFKVMGSLTFAGMVASTIYRSVTYTNSNEDANALWSIGWDVVLDTCVATRISLLVGGFLKLKFLEERFRDTHMLINKMIPLARKGIENIKSNTVLAQKN